MCQARLYCVFPPASVGSRVSEDAWLTWLSVLVSDTVSPRMAVTRGDLEPEKYFLINEKYFFQINQKYLVKHSKLFVCTASYKQCLN